MEIYNLKKTMCCSSPSCTEEVPRAQRKPTTGGSPKYAKTTPELESKGPKWKQDKQRKDYWSGTKPFPSQNTGPKRKQIEWTPHLWKTKRDPRCAEAISRTKGKISSHDCMPHCWYQLAEYLPGKRKNFDNSVKVGGSNILTPSPIKPCWVWFNMRYCQSHD